MCIRIGPGLSRVFDCCTLPRRGEQAKWALAPSRRRHVGRGAGLCCGPDFFERCLHTDAIDDHRRQPAPRRSACARQGCRHAAAGPAGGRAAAVAAFRAVSGVLTTLLVAGCATISVPTPPPPDAPGRFVALTRPVILLGDTQEHESTGFPLHDNDGAVDEYVEVAQRPPEQPLFGRRVLEWALLSHPDEPVIHMGDLLDVSCESELDRMRKVFKVGKAAARDPSRQSRRTAVRHLQLRRLRQSLQRPDERLGSCLPTRSCRGGRGRSSRAAGPALTKRGYIVAYLDYLGGRPAFARSRPADAPVPAKRRIPGATPIRDGFIEAIEAKVLGDRNFARSFVAQKLRLPAGGGRTAAA